MSGSAIWKISFLTGMVPILFSAGSELAGNRSASLKGILHKKNLKG